MLRVFAFASRSISDLISGCQAPISDRGKVPGARNVGIDQPRPVTGSLAEHSFGRPALYASAGVLIVHTTIGKLKVPSRFVLEFDWRSPIG